MPVKAFIPLLRAVIVAGIVAVVGWIGLDIPQEVVEESVDEQFEVWNQVELDPAATPTDLNQPDPVPALVTQVIDGDTVRVEIGNESVTVRLLGIDTPETTDSPRGAECYGEEATARVRALMANQAVLLTTDPTQDIYDQYDRLLAYVTLGDGRDVGQVLLNEGFAREYTYIEPYQKQSAYQATETDAQNAERGLWTACVV